MSHYSWLVVLVFAFASRRDGATLTGDSNFFSFWPSRELSHYCALSFAIILFWLMSNECLSLSMIVCLMSEWMSGDAHAVCRHDMVFVFLSMWLNILIYLPTAVCRCFQIGILHKKVHIIVNGCFSKTNWSIDFCLFACMYHIQCPVIIPIIKPIHHPEMKTFWYKINYGKFSKIPTWCTIIFQRLRCN